MSRETSRKHKNYQEDNNAMEIVESNEENFENKPKNIMKILEI